jgi:putative tricarboxylic transport membrane protein
MSLGLLLFLVLFAPVGFIVAATALFVCAALAFSPGPPLRPAIAGAIFSTLLYLAFTRGLDLALPAGSVWRWMH